MRDVYELAVILRDLCLLRDDYINLTAMSQGPGLTSEDRCGIIEDRSDVEKKIIDIVINKFK